MIEATIAVSLLACAIALFVSPPRGLGVLIASMLLYPEYLRIPAGPCQMSAPRFVALCLVIRGVLSARRKLFRWRAIDTLIVAGWAWTVAANCLAGAESQYVGEMIGRIFDTVMVYFAARFCIAEFEDHRALFIPIGITALVMGVVGVVEAITYWSPYQHFLSYSTWHWFEKEAEIRYGMLRAQASTSYSIYFGMAMCILAGYLYAIARYARPRIVWLVCCLAAVAGALSSLSSGPQMALTVLIAINLLYIRPALIKPALWLTLAGIVFMEAASNRHFWYLIEYINFVGGDSWYRSRLIDVALQQWREYWLIGVGTDLPNHWGLMIDGRNHVDIVNHYIIVSISAGFLGLALFVGAQVLAVRELMASWRTGDAKSRHFVFALGATMFAVSIGMTSVGLYGPPLLLTYLLFGSMVRPLGVYARRLAPVSQPRFRAAPLVRCAVAGAV